MHPAAVNALRCPIDARPLALEDRVLRCGDGHAFDLARQGYANLLVRRDPGTGDDAAMVVARDEVLGSGRFAAVTDALAAEIARVAPPVGVVVDLGAGTGHHLAGVLDASPGSVGIAIDLSRYAARRAARSHPRAAAIVADVWATLPVGDAVAAAVMCVFAPRNAAEIARILRPDGVLVVVTPTRRHLRELVVPLGLVAVDPRKEERLAATLGGRFAPLGAPRQITDRFELPHELVRAVISMGPSADHLSPDAIEDGVAQLPDPVPCTLEVELRTFRRTVKPPGRPGGQPT